MAHKYHDCSSKLTLSTKAQLTSNHCERRDLLCRIVSVRETRLTGIMSHVFIGLSLLFIDQLQLIPRPVLDGLFLYLAVTALHCNQLFERIMLLVTEQVRQVWMSSPRIMTSVKKNVKISLLCCSYLFLPVSLSLFHRRLSESVDGFNT